mmetsp:Transcript_48519/g.103243  ORF Transcript_48519/g.103243 Transcript_48519/m.103243 type:complete len:248 (+) Transcript_48519:205-948(+)
MSSLRKVSNKDKNILPEEDVEAPKDKDKGSSKDAPSASDSFSASSVSGHNPVLIAKLIFRKVITLLIASDEEDVTQPGGIITLLKDIIAGVILGVITISTLIFLDHRDIVHFQSAHNFRNAAFQLLNDPETIANIEESSELKFMTITEYESKKKEIDSVAEKKVKNQEILDKRTKEAEEKKKEVTEIKVEHESLLNNPLLELNKYCGACSWSGKTSCATRVQFLQDTYNTRPIQAKISAMQHPSCKK